MSDALAAQQPAKQDYDWDFFLAHAGDDLPVAQSLYSKLEPPAKVFLDAVRMLPGDDWDVTLSAAQRASLISVILVSSKTEKAYYQREEIAAAIDMARNDAVYHDQRESKDAASLPYFAIRPQTGIIPLLLSFNFKESWVNLFSRNDGTMSSGTKDEQVRCCWIYCAIHMS